MTNKTCDILEETNQPDKRNINTDSWLWNLRSSQISPRIWDMLPASPDNITHINSCHKQLFSCTYIYTLQRDWCRRSILNKWRSMMERNFSFRDSVRKSRRRTVQQQTGTSHRFQTWSAAVRNLIREAIWIRLRALHKTFYP